MTKVKICGITNLEDAQAAVEAGADLLGFIFYEPSPRYVPPKQVRSIIRDLLGLNKPPPVFVGVFVNTPKEMVSQILAFCRLDAAQLHGEETPEIVLHFKNKAYKAIRPKSRDEAVTLVQKYTQPPNPVQDAPANLPQLLVDAYHPALYGGTGHITDWHMAANIAQKHPMMLAGSLAPDNVADAIQAVGPWGVDVSSGVEAAKGKKDHEKVRAFINAVRQC